MYQTFSNVCIRCGKQRISTKTWTEIQNNSRIINTLNECPDKLCQKQVEKDLASQKERNKLRAEQKILALQAMRNRKRKIG